MWWICKRCRTSICCLSRTVPSSSARWCANPAWKRLRSFASAIRRSTTPARLWRTRWCAISAQAVAESPRGRRAIPMGEFLVDTFETTLAPDEVLVEIHVPMPAAHSGSAYTKLERKVGDYAIAGVAAQVTLDGDICTSAGIGLTNVGPKAIQAVEAEQFLVGKRLDDEVIREAARLAATAAQPATDLHGPAEYKRAMVRTLTARTLRTAAQRALKGSAS